MTKSLRGKIIYFKLFRVQDSVQNRTKGDFQRSMNDLSVSKINDYRDNMRCNFDATSLYFKALKGRFKLKLSNRDFIETLIFAMFCHGFFFRTSLKILSWPQFRLAESCFTRILLWQQKCPWDSKIFPRTLRKEIFRSYFEYFWNQVMDIIKPKKSRGPDVSPYWRRIAKVKIDFRIEVERCGWKKQAGGFESNVYLSCYEDWRKFFAWM